MGTQTIKIRTSEQSLYYSQVEYHYFELCFVVQRAVGLNRAGKFVEGNDAATRTVTKKRNTHIIAVYRIQL